MKGKKVKRNYYLLVDLEDRVSFFTVLQCKSID